MHAEIIKFAVNLINILCIFLFSRLDDPLNVESGDMERLMKERRPTNANHSEMLDMMEKTRAVRRYWIENKNPDCTTVIQRFPRLFDMNSAVSSAVLAFT